MDFTVGDSVLLNTCHIDLKGNHKLKPCFIGPFMMVQKVVCQVYYLHLPVALKYVYNALHISLLKPFHSGGDGQDAPAPILVDGEVEYEVDSIMGHQINRGLVNIWFLLLDITCLRHCG